MLPQGVVLTGGNRLTLLLMGQLILRQSRPFSAITTEAEGLGTLKDLQPGLLVVASPLEEGDVISLCRKARQQQAKLSLPGHRCPGGCGAAPLDIGGDD